MIDVHFFPSPNGLKVVIMLEICDLPYRIVPVDISLGEQFRPEFLAISPNNKIPAIVDHDAAGGPMSLFESCVILEYLAEKSGRLLPDDLRGRYAVKTWLTWQAAGLGPMAGQAHHFRAFAPVHQPYAIHRFTNEVNRLYGVLDRRLEGREFVCDALSIADVAVLPWIIPHRRQGQDLAEFPAIQAWFDRMMALPAVQRGLAHGSERLLSAEQYRLLLGQTASRVRHLESEQGAPAA